MVLGSKRIIPTWVQLLIMTPAEVNKIIHKEFQILENDTLPFANADFLSTRKHLAKLLGLLGYNLGAEIGVASGRHSVLLFNNIKGLKLICVDPWKEYDGLTPVSQHRVDRTYRDCLSRLEGKNVEYIKKISIEAAKQIDDESLDFVYIDAAHDFDSSMLDIIHWVPKVHVGGIVAGRNYHKYHRSGAMPAVAAYTRANKISEWYVTSNKGVDPYPTWFWVKC